MHSLAKGHLILILINFISSPKSMDFSDNVVLNVISSCSAQRFVLGAEVLLLRMLIIVSKQDAQ